MMWLYGVAVFLCVAACGAEEEVLPWYKTAVLYQIYPRSFKDSDGDGVGDLKGITEMLLHLKEIGVTATWLSPVFKSPMADFGYDIADFRAIDPLFGTMEDLKELLQTMKSLDIKLLFDLVPNHTSDEHEWFPKSVDRIDPYTDYYVWMDGKVDSAGKRIPPNDWKNSFSGSAWEWNEKRQQYYLHQFMVKQPDLNFSNPLVIKEIDDVIVFWLNVGLDGFRIDSAPYLIEDFDDGDDTMDFGETFAHTQRDQAGSYDLLMHWADVVYDYSKADGKIRGLFTEGYADLASTMKYYGSGTRSLMQPFNFLLLTNGNQSTRPHELRDIIMSWMDAMPDGASANWVIGNHDNARIADRYGPEMVDALNLLTGVLPGVKVIYNGEEIGMQNTFLRFDQTVDPSGLLLGPYHYLEGSRDMARTPMQWKDAPSAGFSSNSETWLALNPNYWWLNVYAQEAGPSHLNVFKAMTAARMDPVLLRGDLKVLVPDADTLVVVRTYKGCFFSLIINMGSIIAEYTTSNLFTPLGLDVDLTVVISSVNAGIDTGFEMKKGSASVFLRPRSAVLVRSCSSSVA